MLKHTPKTWLNTSSIVGAAMFLGSAVQAETDPKRTLGKALYFDKNLSIKRNQSCASCHDPEAAFADPDNARDGTAVSNGSFVDRFGTRNSPSAAYAMYSPFFHWDGDEGMYVGGQFWDGRATTLAKQAAGPFLNPVEMAMPDKWAVVDRLRTSTDPDYRRLFMATYNLDLGAIRPYDWKKRPGTADPLAPGVLEVYDRMTHAIGEFEKTKRFAPFDSKFDYYLAGKAKLTAEEEQGLELFNGKGKCNLCHISKTTKAPDGKSSIPPLFTDFTYDNLGVPANREIPGAPHPADLGLGGRKEIAARDPAGLQKGKFKVMTLRNIALTPPYAHNGVFKTMKEIVHFYNTRDVLPRCEPDLGNRSPGFGKTCWPAPDVPQNVNTEELGNLALSDEEEDAIVAFMRTLSDGWGERQGLAPINYPDAVWPPPADVER